jgi:hypothetical protein
MSATKMRAFSTVAHPMQRAELHHPITDPGSILIVLAAGGVTQDFVSVLNSGTPALLPYKGRPLVAQIIDNHLKRHGRDVVVAVGAGETRLTDFLVTAFGESANLIVEKIDPRGGSPAETLVSVLKAAEANGLGGRSAFVAYGDIYFETDVMPDGTQLVAFVDRYLESDKYSYFSAASGRYKYVKPFANGAVRPSDSDKLFTDIGVYWLPSVGTALGRTICVPLHDTVGSVLAAAFPAQITVAQIDAWQDLGHLDSASRIGSRLMPSRGFNSITVDEARGIITKRSPKKAKILHEVAYYRDLPPSLSIYFPRLLDSSESESDASYSMEFYPYRTLSEYFVYFGFPVSVWRTVLGKILAIHGEFAAITRPPPAPQAIADYHLGKLKQRMGELDPKSEIARLTGMERVEVNGKQRRGWLCCYNDILARMRAMSETATNAVIHGDLCFSNILYDPQTGLLKLIDPRGEFLEPGCYGDPRYDLAKLLHSFHGGYDFVVHDMYGLRQTGENQFAFRLFRTPDAERTSSELVQWFKGKVGAEFDELVLLEALLFLTMLPLHHDHPKRQIAFYLTGINLLSELFD